MHAGALNSCVFIGQFKTGKEVVGGTKYPLVNMKTA